MTDQDAKTLSLTLFLARSLVGTIWESELTGERWQVYASGVHHGGAVHLARKIRHPYIVGYEYSKIHETVLRTTMKLVGTEPLYDE